MHHWLLFSWVYLSEWWYVFKISVFYLFWFNKPGLDKVTTWIRRIRVAKKKGKKKRLKTDLCIPGPPPSKSYCTLQHLYLHMLSVFYIERNWKRKQIQCIYFSANYCVIMHGVPLGLSLWLFAMFFPCQSIHYVAISGYKCQEHSHEIVWNVCKISCHQMKWVNQHRKYWWHGSTPHGDSAVNIQPDYMLIYVNKYINLDKIVLLFHLPEVLYGPVCWMYGIGRSVSKRNRF